MRHYQKLCTATALALGLVFLAACGDDDCDDNQQAVVLPTDLAPGWNVMVPGGDTTCARGTEYAYAVYKGSVNKLVIDFMGGGACWNSLTCSFAGSLFNEEVDPDALLHMTPAGIYDKENPENPFKDWYHVFIPYCTGDIHWGDNVVDYTYGNTEFTIRHKGRINAQAVLDWVYENFSRPETIFVTGCSAGAYGSIGWAPHIMEHYLGSDIYQLGDSGAGVITQTFFVDSFPSWKAEGIMPSFIPDLNPETVDIMSLDLADIYGRVGRFFDDYTVSMYNAEFDENQTFFYEAMGGQGGAQAWSEKMKAMVLQAHDETANFLSFTAPGQQHCILPYANFYTVEADGIRLVDWLDGMVNGETVAHMPGLESGS